jgi:hypothetical protein
MKLRLRWLIVKEKQFNNLSENTKQKLKTPLKI